MSTTMQPPGPTGIDDAFGSVLAAVRDQLADLVDEPTWSLDENHLDARFREALAAKAAVEQVVARLAAELDDRNLARRHGATSTRAHLMATYRMSAPEAHRTLTAARALNGPSALTEPIRHALAAGAVSAEQALVIAEAIHRLTPTINTDVEAAQRSLVDRAGRVSFTQLRHEANHLVEALDPDGADAIIGSQLEASEQRAQTQTSLSIHVHADGSSHGRFRLGPLPTAMLTKALEVCASPRRSNHAENPLTDHTTGDPVPCATRKGLAFAELIEHLSVDGLPHHGAANVTIVVTVDETKLRTGIGEALLDTGTAISAGEARRLACNAGLIPLVLAGDSRVLDLGATRRLFDRYQRLALAHRDRGCVFPGCDRPPSWCEAHHLTPWSQHGPTDLAYGCLLCTSHHHLIHHSHWELAATPDGIIEAIPPPDLDPDQRPIRHERFTRRTTQPGVAPSPAGAEGA